MAQHRRKLVFVEHDHQAQPERVREDQARRRSGAAGPHRSKKHETRNARKGAIRRSFQEG